jgi:hypothetical protein
MPLLTAAMLSERIQGGNRDGHFLSQINAVMHKKKIFFMLAILVVSFMFVACEGDAGPEGPKGDSGAVGAIGAKGAEGDKGDTGARGADGSSVVLVSNVPGSEVVAGIGSWWGWTLNSSQTTFAQAPNSVILVYVQAPSGDWYRVPGPVVGENGTHTLAMAIHNDGGMAQVRMVRIKGEGVFRFTAGRIVVVKSAPNARQTAVDYDQYEAVKEYYNLAD